MDRFYLWGALSDGLLSGLSRETRLSWANVAARLPGIGEKGGAFLNLSDRLAKIETDLARPLGAAIKDEIRKDVERFYAEGLSKLLYDPLPPSDSVKARVEDNEVFFGGPESASEEVGRLYDYFFATVVDRGSASMIPELVEEIVRKVFEPSTAAAGSPTMPSRLDESQKGRPKNDAERRREAIATFAEKLKAELQLLEAQRDALRQEASGTIEQLRDDFLGRVTELESSPEAAAADVLGKLLIERSQDHVKTVTVEALGNIERNADLPDARQFLSAVLSNRLRWIDDRFGEQYRSTLASLKSQYQLWTEVRRDLAQNPIRVIDLSENLRRGELRREIVAGSVQCVIDMHGVKHVRYSPPEASGPPPNFMNWIIETETRSSDQDDPAQPDGQSRRMAE